MLTIAEEMYFRLLSAALWGGDAERVRVDLRGEDWPYLLHLAERQGTAPLIYDVLLREERDGLTPAMEQQMRAVSAHCMMLQEQQLHVRWQATHALNGQGIPVVQIKGFTLARHYPKPYLRSCGDVDIFVGKENYHAGAKVLRDTFPDAPRFDTEEDYFRHYNINVGPVPVEMHRVSHSFAHPCDERRYDRLEQESLHRHPLTVKNELGTWLEPEEKFNVLFVFLHSWEHFVTETASIRQFADIAMLLKNASSPDLTAYLKRNLRRLHVLEAWQLYAYILVHYLGLKPEACPLYTPRARVRAERLLAYILRIKPRKPAEKEGTAPRNVLLRKLYTFRARTRDARFVAQFSPRYARHMVMTNIAQSFVRFLRGQNTRHWE
jgi:hypothetical protein